MQDEATVPADAAEGLQIGGGGHYETGQTGPDGQVLTVKIYGVDVPIGELTRLADRRCGNCWTSYDTEHQGSYVVTRVEKGERRRYRQLCECCVRRYARAHKPAGTAIEALPEEGGVRAVPDATKRRAERLYEQILRAEDALAACERKRAEAVEPYAESLHQAGEAVDHAERGLADARAKVLGYQMVVANHQERMAILQEAVDQVEGDIANAQEAVASSEELAMVKERTLRQVETAEAAARKLWQRELEKGEPHAKKLANRVEQLRHRLALVEARLPKAPEAG